MCEIGADEGRGDIDQRRIHWPCEAAVFDNGNADYNPMLPIRAWDPDAIGRRSCLHVEVLQALLRVRFAVSQDSWLPMRLPKIRVG